ncbi:hypothetical protein NHX12_004069 [Muraenolepis orangiensis]|uniref:Reverse transcriptase domain-containing protein n=1 Tax=Muraenolepis orangiensis TaxID=630683 RepID=A0A9Q0IBU4_9TELE|nr:hypothetical protein NHX12_004069 [Muraenolepis orangiensis]
MLYKFFSGSVVHDLFMKKQKELEPTAQCVELKKLSDTRWACQYNAIWAVKKTLPAILATLRDIIGLSNLHRRTEARALSAIIHETFVVHLIIFEDVFRTTKFMSDQLQSATFDLEAADDLAQSVTIAISEKRTEDKWREIRNEAESLCVNAGIAPQTQRERRRAQTSRHLEGFVVEAPLERARLDTDDLRTHSFYPVIDRAASVNANLSGDFTPAELKDVMAKLKQGKAPGSDNIHPEFVTHQCEITSAWLCAFFSACLRRSKLPRTWRRAAVIALLKPNKPADDPKSYRPISLLCVPFKILERMIHSRIEPVVDSQLPKEQAGFRRGRSTVDQVTLLTQDLEDSFQAKAKAGVVLLDLTAAYDTVWHRGLHLKLLRTIPDRHMVNFIMEMLSNRSFILQTSDGQRSRLRRLRNGVPQGSVLSPMLFNIYIFDLPVTTSRRYGYADDLAIMLHQPTWKAVEEGLNQDMDVLAAYLRSWRLQLSTGKTVSAVFHLCNREARRELEISVENKPLEFQQAPKYLGVRLDRTLSYKQHLDEVRAKVTARVSLIRRLAGTTWGASAKGHRAHISSISAPVLGESGQGSGWGLQTPPRLWCFFVSIVVQDDMGLPVLCCADSGVFV